MLGKIPRNARLVVFLIIALLYAAFGFIRIYHPDLLPQPANTANSLPNIPANDSDNDSVDDSQNNVHNPTSTSAKIVQNGLYLVTKIVDGDTIQVSDGNATHTVRYIGIDTPETVAPGKPVQCFGKEASAKNTELVLGKQLRLEKDKSDVDRYGRWLRYAYLDEVFINLELVRDGSAYAYPYPPDTLHKKDFANAQTAAKDENLGLWGAGCPSKH
jgi:endonuclease YncB( thermonuclease family)